MKKLRRILGVVSMLCALATGAQAATIDFSSFSVGTVDPVSGTVAFSAGTSPNDTYVDHSWSPGNNYLASGIADGTGISPASGYNTFIGVSKAGTAFGSVSFEILSEVNYPGGTMLLLQAFLGNSLVGSASVSVSDNIYHTLALNFGGGADKLFIYDDLNSFALAEEFHIDNFNFTEFQGGQGNVIPEPSTMLLLGAGLAGLAYLKRRKS